MTSHDFHAQSQLGTFGSCVSNIDCGEEVTVDLIVPHLGFQIDSWPEFINLIKETVLEKDEDRVFQLSDRAVDLCNKLLDTNTTDTATIQNLVNLGDWVLNYDMDIEAYTLYNRAIMLTEDVQVDASEVQFAWLGIAKLLVTGLAHSEIDKQAAYDIFMFLSDEFNCSEAQSFLS